LATVLAILVFGYFVVFNFILFVNGTPVVISSLAKMNFYTGIKRIPLVGVSCWINKVPYYNESIFRISFNQITLQYTNYLNRTSKKLGTRHTSFPNIDTSFTFNTSVQAGEINGTFFLPEFTYVEARIERCTPSWSSTCADNATIDSIFFDPDMTVQLVITYPRNNKGYLPDYSQYWTPNSDLYLKTDIFFTKRHVRYKPRFFFDRSEEEFFEFQYFQTYNNKRQENGTSLHTIFFRLSNQMVQEENHVIQFLQFTGSCTAVWGFLTFLFGFLINKVNGYFFEDQLEDAPLSDFVPNDFDKDGRIQKSK